MEATWTRRFTTTSIRSAFVKELTSGSLQAFERLDQALTKPLIGFLRFTMNVPEADAEELAIDTLFAASSHISSFQHGGKAKLTTWISRIDFAWTPECSNHTEALRALGTISSKTA